MKAIRLSLLAISLFAALTSCDSKSEDPQPAVAPAPARNEMSRQLYYPADGHSGGIIYAPADIKTAGRLSAEELQLKFAPEPGQDAITFKVPAAKLTANVVGTYALQTLPTPADGSVDVWYVLTTEQSNGGFGGVMFGSRTARLQGNVTITAYDARRHLISGTYTVRMEGIYDPFTDPMGSGTRPRCNLSLNGSFDNLVLQ